MSQPTHPPSLDQDRCLEVHHRPDQDTYAEHTLLTAGETVSPLATPGLRVEIAALLP